MKEEELISVLKDIYEFFEVDTLYEFEYKGKNKKGLNQYKIKFIKKGNPFLLIENTFEDEEGEMKV